MKLHWRHRWDVTPARARKIQLVGVRRLSLRTSPSLPRFFRRGRLAAVDVAYDRTRDMCFAALVLWDVREGRILGEWTHAAPSTFPYVPGLLSFREIPPLIPLFRSLRGEVDLILCDGQGLAHPRRFGLACHLGVLYDLPSLGWAKSRLIGEFIEPGTRQGEATRLDFQGDRLGWALRSRDSCRPTFVSPGHKISIADSIELARGLLGPHRISEPARAAHNLTRRAMRGLTPSP